RRNSSSSTRERALTNSVFPSPGTPSSSTFPPQKIAVSAASTTRDCPTITFPTASRTAANSCLNWSASDCNSSASIEMGIVLISRPRKSGREISDFRVWISDLFRHSSLGLRHFLRFVLLPFALQLQQPFGGRRFVVFLRLLGRWHIRRRAGP